jgi:transposase-like protein
MTGSKDKRFGEKAQASLLDDEDFLPKVLESYLQRFLERELAAFLGAERYARTEARRGYRNGYKPRTLKTRVGRIELLVPQDRDGQFRTELFGRYQRNEKALVLALQESYIQGVSTRRVKKITEQLCGTGFSKSLVSQLCQELDVDIEAWRNRGLTKRYPYLIIDARYEYIRDNGKVASKAVLIVKGISDSGHREILAVDVANTESEATWAELFRKLKERGVQGVLLVTSDEHKGLVAALRRHFQGAAWQRCQTHFQRNVRDLVPRSQQGAVADGLREVFNAPNLDKARSRLDELIESCRESYPKLADKLDEDIEQTLTCFQFPNAHRKKLRTTNGLERFNEEIARRSKVVRVFPNDKACIRLTAALAMEQSEEWLTGRRYLDMSLLEEQCAPLKVLTGTDPG